MQHASKWPGNRIERAQTIFIQQDNEKSHIATDDLEFMMNASQDEFDIRLICQPLNSPDLNILDFGYFRAIQSKYFRNCPANVHEIIHLVLETFDEIELGTLNKAFLSLQDRISVILKVNRGNC